MHRYLSLLMLLLFLPVAWADVDLTVVSVVSADRTGADTEASLDIIRTPSGDAGWTAYLEASTPVTPGDFAMQRPGLQGDALSTVRRVQLSELRYGRPLDTGRIEFGLLDVSVFLDTSAVANDETAQFLASDLVNDPVIALPDYTLGVVYLTDRYRVALAGARGLSGVSSSDYDQLLEAGGVFLGLERGWGATRFGIWTRSGAAADLGGPGRSGAYLVQDRDLGEGVLMLRLGVSTGPGAGEHVSLAWSRPVAAHRLGIGVARTWSELPLSDRAVAEAYLNLTLGESWQLSPVLQYADDGSGARVAHLRLTYARGY